MVIFISISNNKFERIEDVIKEIDEFQPIINLRLNLAKLMQNLTFDDSYIKAVRHYKNNKKDIDFSNKLKEIRNKKNQTKLKKREKSWK